MTSQERLVWQLDLHLAVFEDLLDRIELAIVDQRHESAAGLAAIACDLASRNHIGRYTDARLERSLTAIAVHVPDHAPADAPDFDVVHITGELTTRAVEETIARWTRFGNGRSGVVTSRSNGLSVLESAARLRGLIESAHTVVVHADPDDVVALLALAGVDRPPTVFVNHHPGSFWVGVGVCDLLVSHDATGSALAVDRRCVPTGRTMLLPPLGAEGDIWSRVLTAVDERVVSIDRALPPPQVLPRVFDAGDVDRVRQLRTAGRADGIFGAFGRHGHEIDVADRPEISVVVIGVDADRTIECLHRVLDTWTVPGPVQLIVADQSGNSEMRDVLDELTGTIRGVRPLTVGDLYDTVEEGLRWAWGPHVAVIADDADPTPGSWLDALGGLEVRPSTLTIPIFGVDPSRPLGVLLRSTSGTSHVEHVFGQVSGVEADGPADWLLARPRRLTSVDLMRSDH